MRHHRDTGAQGAGGWPIRRLVLGGGAVLALLLAACGPPVTAQADQASDGDVAVFPETIHVPPGIGTMQTDLLDLHGRPVEIACSACHGVLPKIGEMKAPEKRTFHQTHKLEHGKLQCRACHNPANTDVLHLADGATVPFSEVITLCAQCHGTQHRDFRHGAHGGMNGYWDRTRGERSRNTCLVCHDPHAPKIPVVQPARGPNDRFLEAPAGEHR